MTKPKKKDQIYDDSWIYILLETTLVILIESLKTYSFRILDVYLTYSIFLLPLVYFITNYITKKYDYKKAIAAISISGVMSVCFPLVMGFALGKTVPLSSLTGEFCAYVSSQFVNLTTYTFLLNNTKKRGILIFLTYIFSLIVYYMFYTLIHLNMIILDNFWKGYLLTLIIQFFITLPIAAFDIIIKRGEEKVSK